MVRRWRMTDSRALSLLEQFVTLVEDDDLAGAKGLLGTAVFEDEEHELPSPRGQPYIESGEYDGVPVSLVFVNDHACFGRVKAAVSKFCAKPKKACSIEGHKTGVSVPLGGISARDGEPCSRSLLSRGSPRGDQSPRVRLNAFLIRLRM